MEQKRLKEQELASITSAAADNAQKCVLTVVVLTRCRKRRKKSEGAPRRSKKTDTNGEDNRRGRTRKAGGDLSNAPPTKKQRANKTATAEGSSGQATQYVSVVVVVLTALEPLYPLCKFQKQLQFMILRDTFLS